MRPSSRAAAADSSTRVSSMQIRALIEGLVHVGVDAAAFSTRVALAEARLASALEWFSLAEFDALMVAAVHVSGDEAFGLRWGERAPMVQFDQLPIVAATAPSLGAFLECLLRFQPVLASRHEFLFEQRAERAVLKCEALALSEQGRRTRTEAVLVALQRMLGYFGEAGSLLRVNVPFARPAYGAEYDRLFGPALRFGQPHASIEFTRAALTRTPRHGDRELHEALRERVERLRLRALGGLSHAQRLEGLLRAALPSTLRQHEAARALGVSERSLRRRLLEEGVSYTALVERVRQRAAEELRAAGSHSAKEIAGALGYESASGFHRAHRRWSALRDPGR